MNHGKLSDDHLRYLLSNSLYIIIPSSTFDEQTVNVNAIGWCFNHSERKVLYNQQSDNLIRKSYRSVSAKSKILKSKVSVSIGIFKCLA